MTFFSKLVTIFITILMDRTYSGLIFHPLSTLKLILLKTRRQGENTVRVKVYRGEAEGWAAGRPHNGVKY